MLNLYLHCYLINDRSQVEQKKETFGGMMRLFIFKRKRILILKSNNS